MIENGLDKHLPAAGLKRSSTIGRRERRCDGYAVRCRSWGATRLHKVVPQLMPWWNSADGIAQAALQWGTGTKSSTAIGVQS
jgi:hypothetical protein